MRIRHWILLAAALLMPAVPTLAAQTVVIVQAPNLGAPSRHGLATLEAAVRARHWKITHATSIEDAHGDRILCVSRADGLPAWQFAPPLAQPLSTPEALAVQKFELGGKRALLIAGADERGLMYALLEAAASVAASSDATEPFDAIREVQE